MKHAVTIALVAGLAMGLAMGLAAAVSAAESGPADSTKIVGTAQMDDDGVIILRVNTGDGGVKVTRLAPPAFGSITVRAYLPALKPGATVDLPEWVAREEEADDAPLPAPVYANSAAMAADGTITLHAEVRHGTLEPTRMDKAYARNDPAYADVLGLTGAMAPGQTKALPGQSSDPALLQARFLTVADGISLTTQIGDVLPPMGTPSWAIDQPCSNYCARQYEIGEDDGDGIDRAQVTLFQLSTRLNADNYHYDRPFEAQAVEVTVALPAGKCFDAASWTKAMVGRGWAAPRPFAMTHKEWAPGAYIKVGETMRQIEVRVHGFVTRRGPVGMVLMSDPDTESAGGCLKTVMATVKDSEIGEGIADEAFDAAGRK